MMCAKLDCRNFQLCASCGHSPACPGDIIDLGELRQLVALSRAQSEDYRSQHADCVRAIDDLRERIKNVYITRVEPRFDRLRKLARTKSVFGAFESVHEDLQDVLGGDDSVSLPDLRRQLRKLLARLAVVLRLSSQTRSGYTALLKTGLENYVKQLRARADSSYTDTAHRHSQAFANTFEPLQPRHAPAYQHYNQLSLGPQSVAISPWDPRDMVAESALGAQEQSLMALFRRLYVRKNHRPLRPGSLAHCIDRVNSERAIWGLRDAEVLQFGHKKQYLCVVGRIDTGSSVLRRLGGDSSRAADAIFVGKLGRTEHHRQLGRHDLARRHDIRRVSFLADDEYLLVECGLSATVLRVADHGAHVDLVLQTRMCANSQGSLRPAANGQFDLVVLERARRVRLVDLRAGSAQVKQLRAIDFFEVDCRSGFFLLASFELCYYHTALAAGLRVAGFADCLGRAIHMDSPLTLELTLAGCFPRTRAKIGRIRDVIRGGQFGVGPSPVRFVTQKVQNRLFITIENLAEFDFRCRAFAVDLPSSLAPPKRLREHKFAISMVSHGTKMLPNFERGSNLYKVEFRQEVPDCRPARPASAGREYLGVGSLAITPMRVDPFRVAYREDSVMRVPFQVDSAWSEHRKSPAVLETISRGGLCFVKFKGKWIRFDEK